MTMQELMAENLMELELVSAEKEEAIRELASLLKVEQRINNTEAYMQAVLKREQESTTGIGFGVGIPHGKTNTVNQPSLCFGRSVQGITYDSMDGEPVHLLFLIAVPENSDDQHLRILSQLSRKLMHQEIRDQLMRAQTKEDIYKIISN